MNDAATNRDRARAERTAALLIALVAVLLTFTPYAIAHLNTPDGAEFVGVPYPLDTNKYFGQMLQGARHGFLFYTNHLTTEAHDPAFLFNFYLALGWLADRLHIGFLSMFHLSRVVLGLTLLLYVHRQSIHFAPASQARLGILAIICFSAGFESITETNTFRSIMLFPHFTAGILLMAVYLNAFWAFGVGKRPALALTACVTSVLLTGVVHPWNLVTMGAVSATFLGVMAWRKVLRVNARVIAGYALIVLSAAAIIGVHIHTRMTNPIFGAMAEQNVTRLRGVWELVSAFGLLWPLALGGVYLAWRQRKHATVVYAALWLLVTLALMAIPTQFQRRLFEGLHLPVCVLAAYCAYALADVAFRKWKLQSRGASRKTCHNIATALVLLATVGYNVHFLKFPDIPDEPSPLFYPPSDFRETAVWMDGHISEGANVMGSVGSAQFLCRYTLLDCFVVHSVETVEFTAKREAMWRFYSGTMPGDEARALLRKHGIEFVVYGPYEAGLAQTPRRYGWLRPVHVGGLIAVYAVESGS